MLNKYLSIWIISQLYCKFPDGKGQILSFLLIVPTFSRVLMRLALSVSPGGCNQVHFHRRIQPRMTSQDSLKDGIPGSKCQVLQNLPRLLYVPVMRLMGKYCWKNLNSKNKNAMVNGCPCLLSSYCLPTPVLGWLYKLNQFDPIIFQHLQKWLNGDSMKL